HPLFRDLLLLSVDPNEYKKCAAKLASARKIIRKIYSESKRRIKSSASQAEAVKARRAFFGRTLSVLKSLENCFSTVRNVQEAFLKLPEIDTEIPSVVIAGAPNVGKSTLLRALTNAKPKVSPYPFTTKELQVGILDLKWSRVQLLDTPGLLDTPLEEKNRVELQAVLAIRHISKLILFVVDPTEMCGFPLEYQRAVYTGIAGNFPHIRQIIVLNKIDAANDEHLTRFRQVFQNLEFIGISAEKKQNLEKLIEAIEEAIEEKTRKV
ncbi:MAG: GTPase, partial [Infirmifilum sp.]